jgi:acetyltransferase
LFRPRSVAVIGASRREGSIGRQIVANLLASGFTGPVHAVNPKARVVHSMPTWPSVTAIPGPVDLAVIVVPGEQVPLVAEQCGRKGVKGLVVVSAGFREIGGPGIAREEKLQQIAERHGMRVIGPNCMGVINTEPEFALNASFAAVLPGRGRVAFVSQSGALGEAILADAAATGLGVAMFASIGNRVDVTAADLVEYWGDDDGVGVILLYIESFGDAARFIEAARRVSPHKPILAVKSGRSAAGAAAIGSHTGAVAGPDIAAGTLLRQCGVLRVESFREMFALAASLLHQPVPKGDRVAVVTNAGGPAILATDALVATGLRMAELAPRTSARLRRALPPEASLHNPVDLIASADAGRYRKALAAVVADPGVDALLVLFVSPVVIDSVAVAEAIVSETQGRKKPVLACLMGRERGHEAIDLLRKSGIPVYRYPEDMVATLRMLVRRHELLARRHGPMPAQRVDRAAAARILGGARPGWLAGDLVERLLAAYGIPVAPGRRVRSAGDAVAAANAIGFPVVVKAEARELLHKTEHRAVALRLADSDAVFAAATDLLERLGRRFPDLTLLVQAQARGHREVLLGMTRDPRYGPLFAAGLGGTLVEVLRDVSLRLAPMDALDAREMFAELKSAALFGPWRGAPAVTLAPAEAALLRLQQLALDFPAVAEVEINPFVLGARGVPSVAVDARLRLQAP